MRSVCKKNLQSICKVTGGFLQITYKVKTVISTFENTCRTSFYGTFTRFLVKICGGNCNLLNFKNAFIYMQSIIHTALRGAEKLKI